jgi:hypothetical protein
MLTDPDSYQRWADAELVRASPQGVEIVTIDHRADVYRRTRRG